MYIKALLKLYVPIKHCTITGELVWASDGIQLLNFTPTKISILKKSMNMSYYRQIFRIKVKKTETKPIWIVHYAKDMI